MWCIDAEIKPPVSVCYHFMPFHLPTRSVERLVLHSMRKVHQTLCKLILLTHLLPRSLEMKNRRLSRCIINIYYGQLKKGNKGLLHVQTGRRAGDFVKVCMFNCLQVYLSSCARVKVLERVRMCGWVWYASHYLLLSTMDFLTSFGLMWRSCFVSALSSSRIKCCPPSVIFLSGQVLVGVRCEYLCLWAFSSMGEG